MAFTIKPQWSVNDIKLASSCATRLSTFTVIYQPVPVKLRCSTTVLPDDQGNRLRIDGVEGFFNCNEEDPDNDHIESLLRNWIVTGVSPLAQKDLCSVVDFIAAKAAREETRRGFQMLSRAVVF